MEQDRHDPPRHLCRRYDRSRLGQGTWEIGDHPARRDAEQQALARGIDLGLTLIDTAELYGDGRSERLVGEVIAGRRDEVFLVSKVRPENASELKMMLACEKSLERLGTDRLDLYLLHWEAASPWRRRSPPSRNWSMKG